MSHRITTKTEIKDKAIAIKACQASGWQYNERGESLFITSGPMKGADVNFRTGEIGGDSDYVSRGDLGALSQPYAEAGLRDYAQKSGITISSRTVESNGDVVLKCKRFT